MTPGFHAVLTRHLEGKVAPRVEIVLVSLPADVQAQVERVQREGSREMFPVLNPEEMP